MQPGFGICVKGEALFELQELRQRLSVASKFSAPDNFSIEACQDVLVRKAGTLVPSSGCWVSEKRTAQSPCIWSRFPAPPGIKKTVCIF